MTVNHLLLPLINRFLARKDVNPRQNVGYEQAKSMGILCSYPDKKKSAVIGELIQKLSSDNKSIHTIRLLDATTFLSADPSISFSDQQIKLLGSWTNPIVPKFFEERFDYLLHLDEEVNPLVENILLKSKALCRIGLYNERNKHLFEMMIKTADDADQSYQMMEIYRYLKQLR